MAAPLSLATQLACARRELTLRRRVYPRWVVKEQMTQTKATEEIAAMEAICGTLETLLNTERREERTQLALLEERPHA